MNENDESKAQTSRWPLSNMLWNGTFNTGSTAEKRVARATRIMLVVLPAWLAIARVTHLAPSPTAGLITMFLGLSLISYYAWEKRKYFLSLDELTKRIELEGMAWAYSLGVLAALWGGGIAYAVWLRWPLNWHVNPWTLCFLFVVFLASVKGAYRYFATRKY